jgi:Skp family chaperone for outer membrane proteins
MKKQASEIKSYQQDIERLKKKHNNEMENIEADTKAKYEELKSMYKSATFKSAMNTSIDKLESQEIKNIELTERVNDLENEIRSLKNENSKIQSKLEEKQSVVQA